MLPSDHHHSTSSTSSAADINASLPTATTTTTSSSSGGSRKRETSLTDVTAIANTGTSSAPQHHRSDDTAANDVYEPEPVFDGTFINVKESAGEVTVGLPPQWTPAQLSDKICHFNVSSPRGVHMSLLHDGTTFRGFIRVHLDLHRPINMLAGSRPPSIFDVIGEANTNTNTNTSTTATATDTIKQSFYIPKGTVKALHITSETKAQEVIRALLNKFKVSDKPQKFALYEKITSAINKYKYSLRRISDNERPLYTCLGWGHADIHQERFVLRENETGEIMWEAFSFPELQNFLKILDNEELEYEREVRYRYHLYRLRLNHALTLTAAHRSQGAITPHAHHSQGTITSTHDSEGTITSTHDSEGTITGAHNSQGTIIDAHDSEGTITDAYGTNGVNGEVTTLLPKELLAQRLRAAQWGDGEALAAGNTSCYVTAERGVTLPHERQRQQLNATLPPGPEITGNSHGGELILKQQNQVPSMAGPDQLKFIQGRSHTLDGSHTVTPAGLHKFTAESQNSDGVNVQWEGGDAGESHC